MYHSMHPGVHIQLPNRKIIPKKNSTYRTKPYTTIKIKPPKPLTSKWYFQAELAKTPLVQFRASATTLDEFYVSYKAISTTISIYHLNMGAIQNPNFKNFPADGYWCRKIPGSNQKVYLVAFKNNYTPNQTTWEELIFLGNTNTNQPGTTLKDAIGDVTQIEQILPKYGKQQWGNPFYKDYLSKNKKVYFCNTTLHHILQQYASHRQNPIEQTYINETNLINVIRYNPLDDLSKNTKIYFKSTTTENETFDPPNDIDLYSANLPIWILTYGFADFIKRMGRLKNIDTEYTIVIQMQYHTPTTQTYVLVDPDFIAGNSPYEKAPNDLDKNNWHPAFQMQQQTTNTIAYSGQGSPKVPTLQAVQAKLHYSFYFKWGGNPPPMSTVADPKNQPYFHLPTNYTQTTSLQNPTTCPEQYLFNFDQRREQLTEKAIRRLQKDWTLTETSFSPTERFLPKIQAQQETTSETSSEEEATETPELINKLRKQHLKHKQLKLKIMETLGYLQKLE